MKWSMSAKGAVGEFKTLISTFILSTLKWLKHNDSYLILTLFERIRTL